MMMMMITGAPVNGEKLVNSYRPRIWQDQELSPIKRLEYSVESFFSLQQSNSSRSLLTFLIAVKFATNSKSRGTYMLMDFVIPNCKIVPTNLVHKPPEYVSTAKKFYPAQVKVKRILNTAFRFIFSPFVFICLVSLE